MNGVRVDVTWLVPSLDLPRDIQTAPPSTAIAVPLAVVRGGVNDIFTRRLLEALRVRRERVFVAGFDRRGRPNPLADAGTSCAPRGRRAGWRVGRDPWGCSGAAVRAAAITATLHGRNIVWRHI